MHVPAAVRDFWAGPGRRPAWRRRTARKALAALLAAVAAVTVLQALRPAPPEPRTDVVVAVRALPAGAVLRDGDVRVVTVPRTLAPAAGSAHTSAGQVVGRTLAGAVEAGEPLRASRLLGPGLLAGLRPDEVAVSVPLTSPALAGAVQVGGRVDVVRAGRVVVAGAPVLALSRPDPTAGDPFAAADSSGGTGQLLLAVGRADALALAAPEADPLASSPPTVLVRAPAPEPGSS